jgi:hypothetical protein
MADNVTLPGNGTPVATKDVGGFHQQVVQSTGTAVTRTVLLNAVTATGASAAQADTGRAPSFSYSLTGTGALTATVLLQARNVASGEWGTLATTTMSGTTAVGEIAATAVRYMEYRVNLTAITGTSATLTATMAA